MARRFGGIFSFLNDEESLKSFQDLSTGLLGFGQTLTLANERGLSPLASLAFGVGGAGSAIQEREQTELIKDFRETQLANARLKSVLATQEIIDEETFKSVIEGNDLSLSQSGGVVPSGTQGSFAFNDAPNEIKKAFLSRGLANENTRAQSNALLGTLGLDTPEPTNLERNLDNLVKSGLITEERANALRVAAAEKSATRAQETIRVNKDGSVEIVRGGSTAQQQKRDFENREELASVQNVFRRGRQLADIVSRGGADVIGTSGFASRVVSAFGAQADSISRKFNLSDSLESYDFSSVEDNTNFPTDAAQARVVKSAVLDLAIMKAQAIGLGSGRALSDRDIQNQINSIGDDFGDPNAFVTNLRESIKNVGLDFQQRQRTVFGQSDFDVKSVLGDDEAEFFFGDPQNPVPTGTTQNPATPQTQQDFDSLPPGSIFVDPQSGEVRRKN